MTLAFEGASDEQVVVSRDELKVFKGLREPDGDTVSVEIEDSEMVLAFLDALEWAKRNTSLQTMIQSRDDFEKAGPCRL